MLMLLFSQFALLQSLYLHIFSVVSYAAATWQALTPCCSGYRALTQALLPPELPSTLLPTLLLLQSFSASSYACLRCFRRKSHGSHLPTNAYSYSRRGQRKQGDVWGRQTCDWGDVGLGVLLLWQRWPLSGAASCVSLGLLRGCPCTALSSPAHQRRESPRAVPFPAAKSCFPELWHADGISWNGAFPPQSSPASSQPRVQLCATALCPAAAL